jgi:hypothetical protein
MHVPFSSSAVSAPAVPLTPGGPAIQPRAAWGGDLPPTGALEAEGPGDVRFLLVHHTAGPNDYGPGDVPGTLRGIYRFHTGPDKGWPDVAYNFFVDRFGGVWEGRTGSLGAPIKGDATGGSQGFALLCCFLGTHTVEPPTAEAQSAMVALLAWLADGYGIDTSPGATASFASRGSSNHPAGTAVTTPTIAGHRAMSATTCPGDAAYALVQSAFPALVSAARGGAGAAGSGRGPAPSPPTPAPAPPASPVPPPTDAPATTIPPTTSSSTSTSTTRTRPSSTTTGPVREAAAAPANGGGPPAAALAGLAGGVVAATAGGLLAWRRRNAGGPPVASGPPSASGPP